MSVLDGRAPAVVDLSAVRYLDSAFLSALVRLRRRLPQCPITLIVETPSVRRVLQLTQMDRLFEIGMRSSPIRGGTPTPEARRGARARRRSGPA